jgi:hypothetical protein
MKYEMLSFAPLGLCALALNSCRGRKRGILEKRTHFGFLGDRLMWFIANDLQQESKGGQKSAVQNEPILGSFPKAANG